MNSQFKKGILELCVLAVIGREDVYGYDLVQKISERVDITDGTIYPLLKRLSQEGYFETYLRESLAGPARKYYSLSTKGKRRLAEMVAEWKAFEQGVDSLIDVKE